MEVLIITGLVLLNGIFSMSEMSLISSKKFKLENARKKGIAGAKTALELSENPTKFFSTVQIGITLISILLGVYSGENLTNRLSDYFFQFEAIKPYSHNIATSIIVISITYLSIVLGELLPKRIGMTYPEPIAIMLARPMKILSIITSPFVWLLTITNDAFLNVMGIEKKSDNKVSEEEIKSIIKESADGGEIQDIEHKIMERVFELGDRKVNTLYTHRSEIVYLTLTDSWEEIKTKINKDKHSAYPICNSNNLDDILGIVLIKDLFNPSDDREFNIQEFIKEPIYFNESSYAFNVLETFKTDKIHYGIVVDEYGITQGIVTMDDVVNALVGGTKEYDHEEYKILKRDENTWLVDGQYSIIEFLKYFNMELKEPYQSKYSTIAGLMIYYSNSLPEIGHKLILDSYELEVIDKDGQRIDKILISKKLNCIKTNPSNK
jgi:putative hemolysin